MYPCSIIPAGPRTAADDRIVSSTGAAAANLPGPGTLLQVSQTQRRVVIAEDEALIRLDLKEMLEEEGYVVAGEAGDGRTAVELADSLKPDLVILDIKMPVLDGISAAEQIAAKRTTPVVILTAFSQRDLVERARDAGAMAYLVKPFTKADLVPAIEMAMSRFTEIRALETEVGGLQQRLEVRKLLDRAKGLLQAQYGLTEPEAFRWIQKTSMDRRMTMRRVAEAVLEGVTGPAEGTSSQGKPAGSAGKPPVSPGKPAAASPGKPAGAAREPGQQDAPSSS
jgi:two-component system, response regulator PdtaR